MPFTVCMAVVSIFLVSVNTDTILHIHTHSENPHNFAQEI